MEHPTVAERIVRAFAYVWATLAGLLILASLAGIWYTSGWSAVKSALSPFNLVNFAVTVVLLSPALVGFYLADRMRDRRLSGSTE